MTPLIDTTLLRISPPWALPPSNVGLEIAVITSGLLCLAHALQRRRKGDLSSLFVWISALIYGVEIEIASYAALDNFWHGDFTVMLWFGKLPLYISFIYPVFLYTAVHMARRLGLARIPAGLVAGGLVLLVDLPFDALGPRLGWWRWSVDDPLFASRLLGVPVANLYWLWAFSAGFYVAALSLGPRAEAPAAGAPRRRALLWSLLMPQATAALGMVPFIPYHLAVHASIDPVWVLGAGVVTSALIATRARLDAGESQPLFGIAALLPPLCWTGQLLGAPPGVLPGPAFGALLLTSLAAAGLYAGVWLRRGAAAGPLTPPS